MKTMGVPLAKGRAFLAAATLGALLAVGFLPQEAQASTEATGWTCYQTDLCHAGDRPCCLDPTMVEELTHCTTMCPG
jgi:hypothetical protein